MLTFPNAKINLGLNITEKRPDGYHNLETIFYPVPIEDALEINILNEGNRKFRLQPSSGRHPSLQAYSLGSRTRWRFGRCSLHAEASE